MLVFREFFKTHSDQNIHQTAPHFLHFLGGAIAYALAYACNNN